MLDGSGKFTFGGTEAAVVSLACTLPGNVICVSVERNGAAVSGVTAPGLSFSRRTPSHSTGDFIELYHAYSSGVFDDDITVGLVGGVSFVSVHAWGVNGCPSTDYWAIAASVTDESAPCDPITITSTVEAATFVMGGFRTTTEIPTAGSGYTTIFGADYQLTEFQTFSSIQTSLGVTVGTGVGTSNGGWADALKLSAPTPTITSIGTDGEFTPAENLQIAGTDLTGCTVEIEGVEQDILSNTGTLITLDGFTGAGYGETIPYGTVTVTVTNGDGTDSDDAEMVPVSGYAAVTFATLDANAARRVEGEPDIESGDQSRYDTQSGTVTIYDDGSVSAPPGVNSTTGEIYDGVWGASGTITFVSIATIAAYQQMLRASQ